MDVDDDALGPPGTRVVPGEQPGPLPEDRLAPFDRIAVLKEQSSIGREPRRQRLGIHGRKRPIERRKCRVHVIHGRTVPAPDGP